MKHALLIFLGLIVSAAALGQKTWTQRLDITNYPPEDFDPDSLTGVIDIETGYDGDLYVLATVDEAGTEFISKISSNDSAIKWSVQVGFIGGITAGYTNNVYPTSDSGCVISYNFWNADDGASEGTFEKFSKAGVLEWSHPFTPHEPDDGVGPPYYDMEAFYVLENSFYKRYYVFVGDSLYELNNSGNVVSKIDSAVSNIYPKPNGDLILQTPNGVYCTDTAGNIKWSLPHDSVLASFPSYIFVSSDSSYQKIDNADGGVIWSIPSWSIPFSGISSLNYTLDGGVIGSCGYNPGGFSSGHGGGGGPPGILFKLDSSGTTVWSKTYNFPAYGLGFVKQLPSGNLATGGAYIYANSFPYNFEQYYSAFVALLDSAGNGKLQSTTYMWPGDSNNNQYLSFTDDALSVMVAMGDSGPKRDTLNAQYNCPYALGQCGLWSDYASDWTNSFCTGVNVKYADFNGDGVIDTNDIALYPYIMQTDISVAPWRKSNPFNHVASNPDFSFVPEHDSIAAGDSINFFIIAGSAAVPVDSIYGLAFSITAYFPGDSLSSNFCVSEPIVNFRNSSLGTIGTDLYTFNYRGSNWYCWFNNVLICRTDHQNVYNLNDTLGIVTLYTDTTDMTDSLLLSIKEFNAVTTCGAVVPFNISNSSVFVYNRLTAINDLNKEYLKIYPNPANHILTVNSATLSNKKIIVYNYLGQLVKELESPNAAISIKTDDLANGVYQLLVASDGWSKNAAFVVEH